MSSRGGRGSQATACIPCCIFKRLSALSNRSDLPTLQQMPSSRFGVKDACAGLPIHPLDAVVADLKGVCPGNGLDRLFGLVDLAQCDSDPYILEDIGYLAEEAGDVLQPLRQQGVDAIFDGAGITQVVDIDCVAELANALDAALALLQARRVPRQIEIDERPQALQVQYLGSGIGPEQQAELAAAHAGLFADPVR